MTKHTIGVIAVAVLVILVNGLPAAASVLPLGLAKTIADVLALIIPFIHISGVDTAVAEARQ